MLPDRRCRLWCELQGCPCPELVEFTDVTPKTRGPLIDNGQLDVVAATYTITDERKKSWDFSTPYRTDYVGLMVKKRSGFTSIEDLDGKVIGVSQGATTQGPHRADDQDNGFSCKPEFRAFSGYPIIKEFARRRQYRRLCHGPLHAGRLHERDR